MEARIDLNEIKRGQMFYANLPTNTEGSVQQGYRPVVIIQNNTGNTYSPVLIVAVITSKLSKRQLPTHVKIDSEKYGLKLDSMILLEQVITISKNQLRDYISELNPIDTFKLDEALSISLQLNKINSPIQQEVNELLEEIRMTEFYVTRHLNKDSSAKSFAQIISDIKERDKLVEKLKELCNQYEIKLYKIFDEFTFRNFIMPIYKELKAQQNNSQIKNNVAM